MDESESSAAAVYALTEEMVRCAVMANLHPLADGPSDTELRRMRKALTAALAVAPAAWDNMGEEEIQDAEDTIRDADLFRALADCDGVSISAFLVQVRGAALSNFGTAYYKAPPNGVPERICPTKLDALRAAVAEATGRREADNDQ